MQFTRDGTAGRIAEAVERVLRPRRAQVAVCRRADARWACILVDGPGRYCDLDVGQAVEDFPCFEVQGFLPPPLPIARTISIYRSVAKRSMGYDAARGDRIVVLVCPREQWGGLDLHWPAPGSAVREQDLAG